jgi:hypothetical protein
MQMKAVKTKMLEKKIYEINKFTDDPFVNDFIKASYFSFKADDNGRHQFQYINITETELQASETHRLIIIKCPHIQAELKNTKIKWDVRENFKDHVKTGVEFPDVHRVIPSKEGAKAYSGIKPENFYSLFKPSPFKFNPDNNDVECVKIDFDSVRIGLNKEYLDTALMVLDGEFDLYVRGWLEPLTFESKDITIVLLPIRYSDRVGAAGQN